MWLPVVFTFLSFSALSSIALPREYGQSLADEIKQLESVQHELEPANTGEEDLRSFWFDDDQENHTEDFHHGMPTESAVEHAIDHDFDFKWVPSSKASSSSSESDEYPEIPTFPHHHRDKPESPPSAVDTIKLSDFGVENPWDYTSTATPAIYNYFNHGGLEMTLLKVKADTEDVARALIGAILKNPSLAEYLLMRNKNVDSSKTD